MRPDISVVIPAYNEGARLPATIESIAATRSAGSTVEVIIADDASTDDTEAYLRAAWPDLSRHTGLHVHVSRLDERGGVPRARNHAAALASADILFITDAHVRFTPGWDDLVYRHAQEKRVIAGTVTEDNTKFAGYGCRLVVPFMGTYWNTQPADGPREVQIAACPATVMPRELFDALGGYDEGIHMYGCAEPELSVRAWLWGAEVMLVPELTVAHRFKPRDERAEFIRDMRPHMVRNGLRFGLLYSSEAGAMQLLRYYALKFPDLFAGALRDVQESDVWERRAQLEAMLPRDFSWFADHFGLKDQAGGELP
jgi:glycosyltransferase involved in cell wall biosynthesis